MPSGELLDEPAPSSDRMSRLGAALLARTRAFGGSLSLTGLVLAIAAFAASTTPSLIPRGWLYQGVISAFSLLLGYAVGTTARWLLARFGVTAGPRGAARALVRRWLFIVGAVVVVVTLLTGTAAQRRIARLWDLATTPELHLVTTAATALGLALALLLAGRGLRGAAAALGRVLGRWLPRQLAGGLGFVAVTGVLVLVVSGIFQDVVLGSLTATFTARDSTSRPGTEQPEASERSGSPESILAWENLGFEGRTFVSGGPTPEAIAEVTGREARMPIRVYAGLAGHEDSADGPDLDEMAQEVVAELDRTDAWDREVLAVVTTTGTGWVDPLAVEALEYVTGGDSAIAAMQYSVNPSWVTLVLDLGQPARAGAALFDAVQSRWADLPPDDRPRLVTFGVSLGSFGSQSAFGSLEDFSSRADGAVWAGTPRFTPLWSDITASRDAGSPEIHPVLDGGAVVRWGSANGGDQLFEELGPTGTPRVAYLQHPSDGVVWWWWDTAWHKDDWFSEPHGQDVIPGVQWWPGITGLQLLGDMFVAGSNDVPLGYGHNYGSGYVDAWAWVTQAPGWDADSLADLRTLIETAERPG